MRNTCRTRALTTAGVAAVIVVIAARASTLQPTRPDERQPPRQTVRVDPETLHSGSPPLSTNLAAGMGNRSFTKSPSLALPVARLPDDANTDADRTALPLGEVALAQRMESEPADETWTSEMESYLLEAIEAAKLDPDSLGTVDCRRSVCLLTFAFDEPRDAAKLYDLRDPDYDLSVRREGEAEYTVYVQRSNPPANTETP